jgi:hypothetical protein
MTLLDWLADPANWTGPGGIPAQLGSHLLYTVIALAVASAIAIPAGVVIGCPGRGEAPAARFFEGRPLVAERNGGLRFDLDVLFLSADRVLRAAPGVPPRRILRCPRATAVIETRAGAGDRYLPAAADLVGSEREDEGCDPDSELGGVDDRGEAQ